MNSLRRGDSLKLAIASRALPLVAGYGLNLVATPVIAASLGLMQFGLWALTGSLAQYGSLLDLGVSRSVTRFTALHVANDDTDAADRVIWTASSLVTCVAVPLLLVGLILADPFGTLINYADHSGLRLVVLSSLVILVAGQFSTVLTGSAYGRERQALPNVVATVCGLLGQGVGVAAAALSRDVVVYSVAVAAWATVTLLVMAVVVHTRIARLRPTRPSWTTLQEMMAFGLKGQSLLLAELVIGQATKVLLGVVSGTAAAGAYELGSRLALGFRTLGSMPFGVLTAPLTRSFSTRGVAGAREHAEGLVTRVTALSIVPPLLGLGLAPALLCLWLGHNYAPLTLATMVALCVGFSANMLNGVQGALADAIGRPGLSARSAIVTAVLSLLFGGALLLVVGPAGLVAGTAAAIVIGTAYGIFVVQKALGAHQGTYYRRVGGPAVLGCAAAALAFLSTAWMSTADRLDAAVSVAVGALVFVVSYGTVAVLRGYIPRHWLAVRGGRR